MQSLVGDRTATALVLRILFKSSHLRVNHMPIDSPGVARERWSRLIVSSLGLQNRHRAPAVVDTPHHKETAGA